MAKTIHRFYRSVYRINRATYTGQALMSRNPRRLVRLSMRRAVYYAIAYLMRRTRHYERMK